MPSIRYAQAVPQVYSIDAKVCLGCGICETVCLAKAIRYADEPRRTKIEVGAVVLATGTEVFDPSKLDTYSYSDLPNVVTSLEFERILSASGPYRGRLMRPYDREEPAKIAWLQCVGSRDLNRADKPYCSSVCCMYAIKEAVIAMEHAHGALDTAIFYMDIRSHGKDFERYYEGLGNTACGSFAHGCIRLSPRGTAIWNWCTSTIAAGRQVRNSIWWFCPSVSRRRGR